MNYKTVFLLFALAIVCTSCGVNISSDDAPTVIPEFITATLPPSPIPQATATNLPAATPVPSITPIEGTTTTQVNVRAQTSTASETLGIISQFAKIQVIGKDASGSWFQIVYPEAGTGYGWVRAEYVQVDASAGIPVVGSVAGSGSGVSGLVIQKINVRSGPAASFDSLGVLNPKDVVFITGKDPSGAWMQIEFVNAPEGIGWAALEFLQVENVDSLPIVGNIEQATPSGNTTEPAVIRLPAIQDGDSMQTPLVVGTFSVAGSRALQINGYISAPDGDGEE